MALFSKVRSWWKRAQPNKSRQPSPKRRLLLVEELEGRQLMAAPILAPIADQTMTAGQKSVTVALSASDPDGDALTFTAKVPGALVGLAYQLDQYLGLTFGGNYFQNSNGVQEKWMQAGGDWYAILPNGQLRRWLGTLSQTMSPAGLVSVLDPTYHADPSKLWNAPTGPVYQLDQQLGLAYPGSYYENGNGLNEKYVTGSNGDWYAILPNGELRKWLGTVAQTLSPAGLVASLEPAYWADPARLWQAEPGGYNPKLGVVFSGNQLTITPELGYVGPFFVQVTASDGKDSAARTFKITVTNSAPALTPVPDQTMAKDSSKTVTLSASDANGDPVKYTATLTNDVNKLAYLVDQQLGITFNGSHSLGAHGLNEKWLSSTTGDWFAILPNGQLRKWLGSYSATFDQPQGLVATLDPTFYADPSKLWNSQSTLAYKLDQQLGLYFSGSYSENAHGFGEKWMPSSSGDWYGIFSNGQLRKWLGNIAQTMSPAGLVATLDTAYWEDPKRLWQAEPGG
jgi:hypothetical protein